MKKFEIVQRIVHPGIVAIMRADSPEHLVPAAGALLEGGVTAMEVTLTTPNALGAISGIASLYGERVLIGAGSVLDAESCRAAILAGAQFIVTPVLQPEVIRMGNRYGKPTICGAYTPTEALAALEAGADFVKIFPADDLGPKFIKNILAPMPQLPLIPTGGVTPETVESFIKAGSVALGIGSGLVSKAVLERCDWATLSAAAAQYVAAVKKARQ
jgi:2-dehydro-3-deoxyphosphogluconate aldolase/(4S)-4-hydroxy-2-oxoglutarate aldolase